MMTAFPRVIRSRAKTTRPLLADAAGSPVLSAKSVPWWKEPVRTPLYDRRTPKGEERGAWAGPAKGWLQRGVAEALAKTVARVVSSCVEALSAAVAVGS